MNAELLAILEYLTREKGIDRAVVLEAIETALVSAARKSLGVSPEAVLAKIDPKTGEVKVLVNGKAVSDAQFGRIAAQTAKQVIFHRIREAERSVIYSEFSHRVGTLITGTMNRFDRGAIVVDLGKTEGILPKREQSPHENFRPGDRIRAYCLEVNKTPKGPQIILSRTHPNLVLELFKLEVPEIAQGIVEIKAIAREPGDRSKMAVASKDEKVDSVGACVGMRGTRVKDIVRELRGEKIDIIRWSPKIEEFVEAALAPAKVAEVHVSEDGKRVEVIVEDDQLSLAIGKHGQNVRLASKLTGLEIDVRTRTQAAQLAKLSVCELPGVGPKLFETLKAHGYESVDVLARSSEKDLMQLEGIGPKTAKKLIEEAQALLAKIQAESIPKGDETESSQSAS